MPRFIHNLPQEEFQKAQNYLDKISVVDSTKKRIKANVQGTASSPYQVSLQKSEMHEEIYGFCSCIQFISKGHCKHIAAVILKEAGEFFDEWNGDFEFVNNAFIMPTPEIKEYEQKSSNEFDDLYENYLYEQKRTKQDENKSPEDFYQDKNSKVSRPEIIWYIIDFYENYTGVKVEFSLQCQTRLGSGRLGKIKNIKIDPEVIRLIPNSLDQEILNLLSACGRWEYSQSKNSSTFHNGDFYLRENRELFKKMIQTKRVIKRTYRYYDVDEDKNLTMSPLPASFRIDINTKYKEAIPYVLIDGKRYEYKDFDKEIYDNLLLKYDVFHEIDAKDKIKTNLYNMIIDCHEKELTLSNEQWNTLQNLLLKNIPHHMFTGDKFNLKIDTVDIYFELYLKWEDNTNLIRGFIYVPEAVNDNTLVELNYEKLETFVRTFQTFNFTDNTFLFESQYLHPLCQHADDFKIPMFFKKQRLKAAKSFNIDVTSGISWLDLHPKLDFNGIAKTINFKDVLKRVDLKANTIQLSDNEIGILPEDWAKKIKLLEQHAVVTKEGVSLHPAKALILDEFPEIKTQKNIRLLKAELENFEQIQEIKEDSNFQGKLRPYQRLALGWFEFLERCRFGGCLADDMGLGKTIQMIAHLQRKFNANKNQKVLILCPKSLTGNWQSEFKLFAPEIRTYNWKVKSLSQKDFDSNDVFFVSYQLFQRQKDFTFSFDYLILDEAQMVKNSNALTHKAVATIQAKHKYALTGTPIENHAGDLMSIFNIVIPGLFESKKIKDPTILENFNFLRPFILRRTKENVLSDLPEKTIQTIYCDQSTKEKKEYLSIHVAMKKELEQKEEDKFSKLMFLQVLTKLRQASNHIRLIDNATTIDSAKIETLRTLVNEIHDSGNKVIIFSQFTKLLKLVQDELSLDSTNSSYLDGGTRNRDSVIKDFKDKKELKTFLISIKAGGVGLNLTNASYCIILDPWWNPAVEAQAIDRIHRIGQKKPVFAYRLITRDTIEEKVHELQNTKKALYDTILESNEGFIKELKKTDIEFLLS